jgi:hypothetical protein
MNGTRFTLTIACDNAAFDDNKAAEVARILIELAERLNDGPEDATSGKLLDLNGNTVGFWNFTTGPWSIP